MNQEKNKYSAPQCEVVEVCLEGVIAASPIYNRWEDLNW